MFTGSQITKAALIGIACISLRASAADLATEATLEELAFQAVHLVDTGQTLNTARHPERWNEKRSLIDGGWIIGAHPSEKAVWRYMGAEAALHAAVTIALVHYNASPWALRGWEAVTIGFDSSAVIHNAHIGIRVRF